MIPTFIAPSQRRIQSELQDDVVTITNNPVIEGILKSVTGLLAVLDDQRRVLVINDTLLALSGADTAEQLFGLRLGDVISCVHSDEKPNGCGTTEYCSSCGAAIAMVTSLANDKPVTRICAATVDHGGQQSECCFQVQSIPVHIDHETYLLIFLQDITHQQTWASMEKAFLHDINNMLTGLTCTTELLAFRHEDEYLVKTVERLVTRLRKEIEMQRKLSDIRESYWPSIQDVHLKELFEEIQFNFLNDPMTKGSSLVIPQILTEITIKSDYSLVLRTLTNMLTNAFEATDPGGMVKLWYKKEADQFTFFVWNKQVIPQHIRLRIFQRFYSTKPGYGRGVGTFSMKLLGENLLKGKVGFTSSKEKGTIFYLTLPDKK